ncbi:aldose epimerase family protein [Hydrogenophaga sp.]|uniref:aldose epimerase family protein n=1 Tax=Hydrogenophaga sp. TaxID=1904254 RepID=UPI0026105FEF|nr:aldose epimerase family protein [Hydrogenophaga sp.]MCW5652864.1 galactose mutarotase [Hydrogenophaga sp.]
MSVLLDPARFRGEVGGQRTALFQLRHPQGMVVSVTNLGAKVLQILVPDRQSRLTDVALGYDSLDAVLRGAPSVGAFIGRYAGRISNARFPWDGNMHSLPANAGAHCIHGGPGGSRHQVFEASQADPCTLDLWHRFDPEVDGFPGTLELHLRYQLTDHHTLRIEHEAVATQGTSPASFTSHVFFNLEGPGTSLIDGHTLAVHAHALLPCDGERIATGLQQALQGLPYDLRVPRRLDTVPEIDEAFVIEPRTDELRHAARLSAPASARTLDVWTTEPVLQVYTAGLLGVGERPDMGKQGVRHRPRAAICLEPQRYPNAPNRPSLPLLRVSPQEPYFAETRYVFSAA